MGFFTRAAEVTGAFYNWEERGRGWLVWSEPVELEPPFRPFLFRPSRQLVADDARKPTFLGSLFEYVFARNSAVTNEAVQIEEPCPPLARSTSISEAQITLAPDVKVTPGAAEHFLQSVATLRHPLSFEIIGTSDSIVVQFAASESDFVHVREQLQAHFPEAVVTESREYLETVCRDAHGGAASVVDFGLLHEFMRPLQVFTKFDIDPLVSLFGALSDLNSGEVGIVQVLFEPARAPWPREIIRAVKGFDDKGLFIDAPELIGLAKEKVSRPLYAVVTRMAMRSTEPSRVWQLARRVGGALAQLTDAKSNELVALQNDDYPDEAHFEDVLARRTRRSGAILNSAELVSLVHPPGSVVRSARLRRDSRRTKAAPRDLPKEGYVLGENSHAGVSRPVALTGEQRLRHLHIIGASGTGKSTLFTSLIAQDIEQGSGFAVLDPHGDLIDEVAARIPESRIKDVVFVDPADTERPIGFNILSAHSDLEKTLLASDLVAVFRRLSTSWGDQMTSVLSNAVLASLESFRGGSLADLRRFLIEVEFREEFLSTVKDPEVVYYWRKEFPLLAGKPQAPLLTRLDAFLRPRLVRGMVAQTANRLDFASIMNEGKILLVKLAQGAIGEENAALLGTLFVAKIHQLVLGRQAIGEAARRPFYVYIDEFQHFVTPSMATLLTGARKYRVGLVLAHQELRQLSNQDRDVAGAVLANAATRICFRVGDQDARKLEDGFSSFTARDLQNLGLGQAAARVDRGDWDFSLSTAPLSTIDNDLSRKRREEVVRLSRETYGSVPVATADTSVPPASPSPRRANRDLSPPAEVTPSELVVDTTAVPPLATPFGRGGAQHKYLQELIRRWAETSGWRVTIEKQVLDGLGSIDVALERDEQMIACEICVMSTTDYEIGNVRKCIAAGSSHVILIVADSRKLSKVRARVSTAIDVADQGRVIVTSVPDLFNHLRGFEAQTPAEDLDQRTRGYKVRVKYARGSEGTARTIAQTVGRALQRLRRQ